MKQNLKIEIPLDKLPFQRLLRDFIYDKYGIEEALDRKDEKLAFFLLMENPEFFSFIERAIEKYGLDFCVNEYLDTIFESVLSKNEEGKSILLKIQKRLKKEERRKVREEKSRERDYIEYLKGKGYTISQTGF